ncbi:MAG: hypothetical protein KTR24_05835 [Saprospiraceae bacterium]|nr:hypothetical protein [Saprospiraceae bacterium]
MRSLLATLLAIAWLSCGKSLEADIPTYIQVTPASLIANTQQGGSTHGITEAWIYADSAFIGAHHAPARLPLLGMGTVTLEVFPGIRQNALGSDLAIYPFLRRFTTPITLDQSDHQIVSPSYVYLDNVTFPMIEQFESGHRFTVDLDQDPATTMTRTNLNPLDGSSGLISLRQDAPSLEVASDYLTPAIPGGGRPVYLEFDYRADVEWQIGVAIGEAQSLNPTYLLQLRAQSEWQKVYLNLSEILRQGSPAGLRIAIRALYDSSLTIPTQDIQLDNIKLVHFAP